MRRQFIRLAGSLVILAGIAGYSAQKGAPAPLKASTANHPRVIVPAETTIPLELRSAISSRTAYVGQGVYCQTIYPIAVGDRIIIPVGTYVKGEVTQVKRPGRIKGRAQLGLRFDSMTLPNGVTVPLGAPLSGFAGNGNEGFERREGRIQGASTKGQDTQTIATTATEGTVIGGLSTRSGKGAGFGALGGGLAGLAMVLATRGKEIVLPAGTDLELQLTRPLVLDRDKLFPAPDQPKGPALPPRQPGPGE